MKELKGIEEKILDRALYLFGKNGSTNVSIRKIVKEAEVNVSAKISLCNKKLENL